MGSQAPARTDPDPTLTCRLPAALRRPASSASSAGSGTRHPLGEREGRSGANHSPRRRGEPPQQPPAAGWSGQRLPQPRGRAGPSREAAPRSPGRCPQPGTRSCPGAIPGACCDPRRFRFKFYKVTQRVRQNRLWCGALLNRQLLSFPVGEGDHQALRKRLMLDSSLLARSTVPFETTLTDSYVCCFS
ncbi:unnamed protein product [Bubo scandiacus]